tara:strand:+ start:7562 stop:7933 length:372 start_codon:yes stop_codon:yes gene_type:complete
MKQLTIAAVALFVATAAQAHQWTPTYPKFEKSYVEGVVVTTMKLFNKRFDVEFYEINVYDEKWNPIKFATATKIVEVGYLERKNIDIYVLEEDCDRIKYICTVSKLLADDDGNGVNSRICSKV